MIQSIHLPTQIVAKVTNRGNILADAVVLDIVKEDITNYANEIAMVSIVMSDAIMQRLYVVSQGYMNAIGLIANWANEFVALYADVTEWDEFVHSDRNPYKNTTSWDDVVTAYAEEKLQKYRTGC
jgi:hypothetical protein